MNNKSNNLLSKYLARALVIVVTVTGIATPSVKATTQDPANATETTEETSNTGNLLDVLGLIVNSFMTGKIPNFSEIIATVFGTTESTELADNTPSKLATKVLSNKPQGSYAIAEDEAEAELRRTATEAIETSTLGSDAQTKMKDTVKKTELNVKESVQLAESAQSIDVTQQILQKMAAQEGLAAVRDGILIRQNQQAQVDRAIENTLAKEQLRKLSEADTKEKAKEAIRGNNLTLSSGLVSMPGLIDTDNSEKVK
jgi:hypothetical protein